MHIPITGLLRSIPASEYTINCKRNFGNSAPACHTNYLIELNLVPRDLERVGENPGNEVGLNFAVLHSHKSFHSLVYSPEETIFDLRSIRAWLNND